MYIFIEPLEPYLAKRNMQLSDIDYYMTLYNKDRSIERSQFKELINNIKNIKELILLIGAYPNEKELKQIKTTCKKYNCKIIIISKSGESIFRGDTNEWK